MISNNKRLSILSDLEAFAFYGPPDFDDEQRSVYFAFEEKEWLLILESSSLHNQVYCAVQIGYFKAKKTFFRIPLNKIPQEDIQFILSRYFLGQELSIFTVKQHEYYRQCHAVCQLFGYDVWSNKFLPQLINRSQISVRRDASPHFIAHELLSFLETKKIVRPGYTTLQKIVSHTLAEERNRLKICLQNHLTDSHRKTLKQLICNETTLSELAALKQDAKSFSSSMMNIERKKHGILKPLHDISKMILPTIGISQQNISHYASLAHYYTIYDLNRFDDGQTHLYLLCYVLKRYQQINDTLCDAFGFYVKKLENEIKQKGGACFSEDKAKMDQQIGRLLLLYVDDGLSDSLTLGETRRQAFEILPKEFIQAIGERMLKKRHRRQDLQWKERDKIAFRYKHHLRPLFMSIEFESHLTNNPLLKAIHWMKSVFTTQKSLLKQPFEAFPAEFVSKRLEPYLRTVDKNQSPAFHINRYEILVYRQIAKQMETGALHITDSIRHRPFAYELVSIKEKEHILEKLNIPWLASSCEGQIEVLFKELETLWSTFNANLAQGKLKYLKYDKEKKVVKWIKPKIVREPRTEQALYDKIPLSNVSDVLRFVSDQTDFLSAFSPLQPRYKKLKIDEDHLVAVFIAQAMNIGHYKMAQTSDISYPILESTYQQYVRVATLKKAQDKISNTISRLSIFPHYTFDFDVLYASVDGQKFEALTPTTKARYSRKYYKKGRGVVAYTLLSNHVPLQCELIGAHEHESHFVFDIWYGNTSLIQPMVVTGDMHSVNKANFALFHWFGGELRPRFTNLKKEITTLYGAKDPFYYQDFLVQPAGQLDKQIILDEKENIDRVIATLALKEISQGTLIKKLCDLSPQHPTRKAIFEFNKLIRSIYTLKCVLDPQILSDVHRSQNRIESYHTLRAAITKVGGRKALLGNTDLEVELSNQCGRLIAGAIIYYNASIQSRLLERSLNSKQLKDLKKSSPVAWQHIHFTGQFTFYNNKAPIDIDKAIENIEL